MSDTLAGILSHGLSSPVTRVETENVLAHSMSRLPDLFIIDGTQNKATSHDLFRLISDLRSRKETRLSPLFVILPDDAPDVAALVLDLGADDEAYADISDSELIRGPKH